MATSEMSFQKEKNLKLLLCKVMSDDLAVNFNNKFLPEENRYPDQAQK
jgi:hypothetical protein